MLRTLNRKLHTLPSLPFATNALEPVISKETVEFHYGKHHAGYVAKLNTLVDQKSALKSLNLEGLMTSKIQKESPAIFNNAAQIWNHTFYWKSMVPSKSQSKIPGDLEKAITKSFGSFEAFKKAFSEKAAGHFGSGWVWLVAKKGTSELSIIDTHDAYNPLVEGTHSPLLVIDVWEHAYYIDKRNDRAAYISGFFNILNWGFAASNLEANLKKK